MRDSHQASSGDAYGGERDRATLRASDADREHIASRLRRAASEGQLSPDELEQRLHAAYSATTLGELDWLVCDLPSDPDPTRPNRLHEQVPQRAKIAIALGAALVVTVLLVAAVAGVGFGRIGRSSSAAASQPQPPAQSQTQQS